MQTVLWTFHLRWLLWGVGWLGVAGAVLVAKRHLSFPLARIEAFCDRRFRALLWGGSLSYVALGWLEKFTQLRTFQLNSEDFWLFEDMLRNISSGGYFLTRFAPQSIGMVQHGAVHAMWTWSLGIPLAWILGPTQAALLYGPLAFGLAAVFLGLLARPRAGSLGALLFAAAFLCSTQVGKILQYDVHPEVAYPLTVFLWAWGLGLGDRKVRWSALIAGTFLGIGVKQDSFLVFFPLLGFALYQQRGGQRRAAVVSSLAAVCAYSLSVLAIGGWSKGQWGPNTWAGLPVIIPRGADLLNGIHWSSPSAILEVTWALLADSGGILGAFQKWIHFWLSRPWLSILILGPWTLASGMFLLTIAPLTLAYSLLQRASILNLYYAAPFLGTFWLCAVLAKQVQKFPLRFATYAFLAACVFGNGAPEIHFPTREARSLLSQAKPYLQCLPPDVRGLVQTPLLEVVPRNQVLSERIPRNWNGYDFVILAPGINSYELSSDTSQRLIASLKTTKEWEEATPKDGATTDIRLFLKRGLRCRS